MGCRRTIVEVFFGKGALGSSACFPCPWGAAGADFFEKRTGPESPYRGGGGWPNVRGAPGGVGGGGGVGVGGGGGGGQGGGGGGGGGRGGV